MCDERNKKNEEPLCGTWLYIATAAAERAQQVTAGTQQLQAVCWKLWGPTGSRQKAPPTRPSMAPVGLSREQKIHKYGKCCNSSRGCRPSRFSFLAFVSQGQPQAGAPSHVRACAWPAPALVPVLVLFLFLPFSRSRTRG